jgi:hypothetical protein
MFCGEVFKRKSKLCKKLRRMYLTVWVEKVDLNMNIGIRKVGKNNCSENQKNDFMSFF